MNKGNGVIGFIIFVVLIWGVFSLFNGDDDNKSLYQEHPNYEKYRQSEDCSDLEPNNPYSYGSGHYAGFEWGTEGNYCSGNSDSFIEGCEDYQTQEDAYQTCLNNN